MAILYIVQKTPNHLTNEYVCEYNIFKAGSKRSLKASHIQALEKVLASYIVPDEEKDKQETDLKKLHLPNHGIDEDIG